MKKLSLSAIALGTLISVSTVLPAEATPNPVPSVNRTTDVLNVARVVVKYGYWRGHRGYRYRRPGYRLYNGFWYPPAAFGATVIVGPRWRWGWCGPRYHRHRCRVRY